MCGKLVVIEGIDGAGTTTQSKRLAKALSQRGLRAHLTREPSDGPIGRLLREILAGNHAPVDATTMALLFASDRADHLQREVEPNLEKGAIVVSDRWYHSSLAYQGSEEDREWILTLNSRARRPDLTFLLEVPPEVAAERRREDRRPEELYDALNVQRRVAEGYRAVVRLLEEERIEVLSGDRDPEVISSEIIHQVEALCCAGRH